MNETIICRCEDVTKEEIIEAINEGYDTLEELKMHLRLGMGPCQGRTCLSLAAKILAKETGGKLSEIKIPVSRPPILPVSLGMLTEEENEG